MLGEDSVARARALIGTPFLLHGRDPQTGVDCVGLVALAYQRTEQAPLGYSLRTMQPERWMALLDQLCPRHPGPLRAGVIMLLQAGPGQLHCGLWTGESLIHADAGLRRVVETPGEPRWPLLGCWMPINEDDA